MKISKIALMSGLLIVGFATAAIADVDRVTARLRGGCNSTNKGSCSISALADGSDLSGVQLYVDKAEPNTTNFKIITRKGRSVSSSGAATFKFKNDPRVGVKYRVITFNSSHISNVLVVK